MLLLRTFYLLGLAVWLGGMVTLGAVVAPVVFGVLQASLPEGGRLLAGSVFGTALARFHQVAYLAGGIMLVALAAMSLLERARTAYLVPLAIVTAMLLVALYSGVVVLGEIDGLQRQIGGLASSLASGDPRRLRFDTLHVLSTRLMMVNLAGGFGLVVWEAARVTSRPARARAGRAAPVDAPARIPQP